MPSVQVPGRWGHWESAESSASDQRRIEPQEECKLKTQGVDMEAPHPQPTGLHLVPTLQLALGGISAAQLKDPLTSAWRVSRRCGR